VWVWVCACVCVCVCVSVCFRALLNTLANPPACPSHPPPHPPPATVLSFYDFWTTFASWREFNADPELDLNQASCREEKRWLQRQIDKEKKEKKTEENARVRTLVDSARKWDPRVIKHKAELAAAAAAAKAEKERAAAEEKVAQARAAKEAAELKVLLVCCCCLCDAAAACVAPKVPLTFCAGFFAV
jgi:hypothetical protein